jgi:hypothetical protein
MAYNPNDCPEVRWGASEGSPEMRDVQAPRARALSAARWRSIRALVATTASVLA